jgi:hypothetical protein
MQRPCHRCGFTSDRPTRFCRQCGAQLFVENEASSATTRQYGSQQPANPYDAPYQSQLAQALVAQNNRSGGQTPNTSRLYPDPMAPINPSHPANYSADYPANYPASYQQAVARKSGALKWILITLLCVALISGAISAMVIHVIRTQRGGADEVTRDGRIDPPPRPQEPAPPASVRGSGLEQYKYPNAKVEKSVNFSGNEVIEMTTSDSVSKVGDYYKRLFGTPMVESSDSAVVFQIPGPPMTIITIDQDDSDSDKTGIKVVRTNFQFPKIN